MTDPIEQAAVLLQEFYDGRYVDHGTMGRTKRWLEENATFSPVGDWAEAESR